MDLEGFDVYRQEWWRFDFKDWSSHAIGTAAYSELQR
jgi:D-alanyl-D-alanine dipeptidase